MSVFTKVFGRVRRKLYEVGRAEPVYVVSYPKCGRTWLRYMLERYLDSVAGIEAGRIAEGGQALKPRARPYPAVHFTHDDDPEEKRPSELSGDKSRFQDARVVFLVRDPRDVTVSIYFEKTRRSHLYRAASQVPDKLGDLLGDQPGGLSTIVSYYNSWWANRTMPRAFLLMRYEDMLAEPQVSLRRFCEFAGYPLDAAAIEAAVSASDFSQMRQLETTGDLSFKLAPGHKGDPESYKTRRGVAGGFVAYFTREQIDRATEHLRQNLAGAFGYPDDKAGRAHTGEEGEGPEANVGVEGR